MKNQLKYYALGLESAGMVFVGVFIGYRLDTLLKNTQYYFTLIASLIMIFYVFYRLVRRIKNEK